MSKRSGGGATAKSAAGAILRMARGNVREKSTVESIINISTNYVGVDKRKASN